ncbi:hypothetical protein BGZ67_004262 [Mortierella alpina]|nr:hypothetical protein BGZ67_004262 [Mortierella alpina]
MEYPNKSNINITITPCTRPSTMDTVSTTPRDYNRHCDPRLENHHSINSLSSSASSSSSSLSSFDHVYNDYISHSSTHEHVPSSLSHAHSPLETTRSHQPPNPPALESYDSDHEDFNDSTTATPSSHYRGAVTRDHALGQQERSSSKLPTTQPHRQIKYSLPHQHAFHSSKGRPKETFHPSSCRIGNKVGLDDVADENTTEYSNDTDSRESYGSRGTDGGHFFTHENPPLVPVSHQQAVYEQRHGRRSSRHPPYDTLQLGEDERLNLYRTTTCLSGYSYENAGSGNYGKEGGYNFNNPIFQYDAEMERVVVRKLDRNLLPLLGILYLFSYLDRVNIGNARLFGLEEAVHLTNDQYNIALAAFFLAYCIFEMPSNWILVRVGPRTWIPILMIVWGGVSLGLAWVTSFPTLLIARFALGTAEAGFVPGVLFYLTLFYKRSEHSLRISIFLCFNILAGAFGGLLAAGISRLSGALGLQGWQWIFIIEAIPTMLLAILTWFIMSPSPEAATFLTKDERIYAANRILMDSDVRPTQGASWRQTKAALSDYRIYIICLAGILLHMPVSGVVLFLPSLIADMGFQATTAQLLTVPIYLVAACASLIIPWWSDRIHVRGTFVIFVPIVSLAGFIILAIAPWTWVRYVAVILALSGMVPTSAILTSWLTNNCVGHSKRATSLAMLVSAGSLASMAEKGHLVMASSILLLILTAIAFRFILARENRRRDDNLTKGLTLIQFMSEGHLNDLGDMHPNFRYTL